MNEALSKELIGAASFGNVKRVQELLDQGADIDTQGGSGFQAQYGWTALMQASKAGHVDITKLLLEKGAKVDIKDKYGWTSLMYAAKNGYVEITQQLLDKGANINAQNDGGVTALMRAAENGHTSVAKQLLARGADINIRDKDGKSALNFAADFSKKTGNTAIENELKKVRDAHQPQPSAPPTKEKQALSKKLREEAWNGNVEPVRKLLAQGADIDAQDEGGMTALMYAARDGHTKVAKLLLDNKANVSLLNNSNETALTLATQQGRTDVVTLLRETTNKVAAGNQAPQQKPAPTKEQQPRPSADASKPPQTPVIPPKERRRPGQPSDKPNPAPSADSQSSQQNQIAKNKALFEAIGTSKNKDGSTPKTDMEKVKAALEAGADPNVRNQYGFTPLMYASVKGDIALANLLTERGSVINVADPDGNTPLMFAVSKGNLGMAQTFIDKGADVHAQTSHGETVWALAVRRGNSDVTNAITEATIKRQVNQNRPSAKAPNPPSQHAAASKWMQPTTAEPTLGEKRKAIKRPPTCLAAETAYYPSKGDYGNNTQTFEV